MKYSCTTSYTCSVRILESKFLFIAIVEPVLRQDLNYCHVNSAEFEVLQPAKKDEYQLQRLEVVCRCEETQESKTIEWPENERVRISELEPGVQYTVTATAHYPNDQSVSATKTLQIPKQDGKFQNTIVAHKRRTYCMAAILTDCLGYVYSCSKDCLVAEPREPNVHLFGQNVHNNMVGTADCHIVSLYIVCMGV